MMSIREAEMQDFQAIILLMRNVLGYPGLKETEAIKRLEYFKQSKEHATFVAVADAEISGFIGVMRGVAYTIEGYYAEILILAVSEKYRRGGIGSALVKRAEEWARQNSAYEIGLHSNFKRLDAHLFYERNGYQKRSYWFYKDLEKMKQ